MVSAAGGNVTIQAAQRYEPIRMLLRAGKNAEAIAQLCPIIVTRPDDLDAKELLFDAFFQGRNWEPAVVLAQELAAKQPQIARFQRAFIATLSNMKRYDGAIAQAKTYVERHGEDIAILDIL